MELATNSYIKNSSNLMKLLIIGDSHTLRLANSTDEVSTTECLWNKEDPVDSNCVQTHLRKSKNLPAEVIYSGHRGKTGYKGSYFEDGNYPCLKKNITEDFIILPWFGYIDIKQFLPLDEFKDKAEIAVTKYLDNTLKYFKNNKIRFIEPLPQFINPLGSGSPLLSFEERQPYYLDYLFHLNKQCLERGLEKPISIEKILGTDRLYDFHECHDCPDCLDPRYINFKLDHPKKEYFSQILDGILAEML
jgi:hypothetical protein